MLNILTGSRPGVHPLYERAATTELVYGGFARTTGCCTFCGKFPDSTGRLHRLTDSSRGTTFEIGPECFRDLRGVLERNYGRETDPVRKQRLRENLDCMCRTVYARDNDGGVVRLRFVRWGKNNSRVELDGVSGKLPNDVLFVDPECKVPLTRDRVDDL